MSAITDIEIKKMTKEQNYLRGYADGRADAIEECIAEINKLNIEVAYHHTICNILEQLKEQNNDDGTRSDN